MQCGDTSPPIQPFLPALSTHVENCTINWPLAVAGTTTFQESLRPGELDSPKLVGSSCTIDSVLSTSWEINDWLVMWPYTDWIVEGRHDIEADFWLRKTGRIDKDIHVLNNGADMSPYRRGSDPNRWYPCGRYPTVLDPVTNHRLIYCFTQLDLVTGYFAVNQSWYCDDKDPNHL